MKKATKEQVEAVQRMQDLIEEHLERPLDLGRLAEEAGYSAYHATRLFKELVGIPPSEYLRARRLSHAALGLRDGRRQVNETAVDVGFETHAGFTRAFSRQFGETPSRYRAEGAPIRLFMGSSVRHIFELGQREEKPMTETTTIYVRPEHRPARKLILQRGHAAGDYFAYCEELGCDVYGVLLSMHATLGEPMGLWLPESMRKPGTSEYVMGVEVALDYAGPIPEGMEVVALAPQDYLVFQGPPYDDADMGEAVGRVWHGADEYRPETIGWAWSDRSPRYQLAPIGERGYIEGRPVTAIELE
jgi:AraC family transcriptional regulator